MAVMGLQGLAQGQGLALLPHRSGEPAFSTPALVHRPSPVAPSFTAITDDGGNGDEYTSTSQLIIALESDRRRSITVEVFNELGRTMRSAVLTAWPGRNALALDVAGLHEGRYVAVMQEGASARVVRFRR
ncbi:MAG: hypothetical protein KBH07_07740 [Flavobacteriales bacterium]|nr:hypothetical protein [Flavobacteriales bacterium]MBP9078803.1 hypothetical protein [Flavobacteriales bacterium]